MNTATVAINRTDDHMYDVIIVGAGVAGLMLARFLDDSHLRVLLLERKPSIKVQPATFGTFTETAKAYDLEQYIIKYFDTWAFYGPTVKASRTRKRVMCLVDYQGWARDLKLAHVAVRTNVALRRAQRVAGGIVLEDQTNQYEARLVVDASGYAQIVQQLLGLRIRVKSGLSHAVELDGCDIPETDEASFILDFRGSNSGGWLYVLSKTRAQFGWADFYPESVSTPAELAERVEATITTVGPQRYWTKGAKVIGAFGRFGPSGSASYAVHDNLLAIGDAGGLGTPLTLEGFRQSLLGAKLAHATIVQAKNYSAKELSPFVDRFRTAHGRYYRAHEILRFIYLRWARNEELDRWVSNFQKLAEEDFFRLIRGELTMSLMVKTLDLILVKNLLLNVVNSCLPLILKFRRPVTPSKREMIDAPR